MGARLKDGQTVRVHVAGLLSVALAAGVWGCEPELTEGLYEEQVIEQPDDDDNDNVTDEGVVVDFSDLTGTWALAVDMSTCVTLFKTEEVRNRTLSRVTITQEGLALREVHQDCESNNTPTLNLETLIPVETVNSANPLEVNAMALGTRIGDTYRSELKTRLWGIEMEDALRESFPASRDELPDERIFDGDEDGNPGVTLRLGDNFCEIYIAQRALESLKGTFQADGSIAGPGTLNTVQLIIGASNEFCAAEYEIAPNDAFSRFRMVRIGEGGLDFDDDGDGEITCEEIIANRDRVLVYETPDDERCAPPTQE